MIICVVQYDDLEKYEDYRMIVVFSKVSKNVSFGPFY